MTASGDKRYRGISLDERRAQRREALIHAAILVYGEHGYRNATVRAVCAAAGLTERYFYESFAHSEALLIASFQAVNRIVLSGMERASAACTGTGEDKARAILEAYFSTLQESPKAARVFLVEIGGVSRGVDAVLEGAIDDFGILLERTLGQKQPAPVGSCRWLVRSGAVGGVLHIAVRWIAGGYAQDVPLVGEAALRLIQSLAPNAACLIR